MQKQNIVIGRWKIAIYIVSRQIALNYQQTNQPKKFLKRTVSKVSTPQKQKCLFLGAKILQKSENTPSPHF